LALDVARVRCATRMSAIVAAPWRQQTAFDAIVVLPPPSGCASARSTTRNERLVSDGIQRIFGKPM
jgi:hypothetical protein